MVALFTPFILIHILYRCHRWTESYNGVWLELYLFIQKTSSPISYLVDNHNEDIISLELQK